MNIDGLNEVIEKLERAIESFASSVNNMNSKVKQDSKDSKSSSSVLDKATAFSLASSQMNGSSLISNLYDRSQSLYNKNVNNTMQLYAFRVANQANNSANQALQTLSSSLNNIVTNTSLTVKQAHYQFKQAINQYNTNGFVGPMQPYSGTGGLQNIPNLNSSSKLSTSQSLYAGSMSVGIPILGNGVKIEVARQAGKWLSEADYISKQGDITGKFLGSYYSGSSEQALPQMVYDQYMDKKEYMKRRFTINKVANYSQGGNVIGGIGGGLAGLGVDFIKKLMIGGRGFKLGGIKFNGSPGDSIFNPYGDISSGASYGSNLGTSLGASYGAREAARSFQKRSVEYSISAIQAANMAQISSMEYQSGLSSRLGKRARYGITSDISMPLASHFDDRFGYYSRNQYKNNYLQATQLAGLSTGKISETEDFDLLAEKLKKVGVGADQFGKYMLESTRYQLLGAKSSKELADRLSENQAKYGNLFTLDTQSKALSLQQLGYSSTRSDELAMQYQFNPMMEQLQAQGRNSSVSQFYTDKAIGKYLGIDINKSMTSGKLITSDKSALSKINKLIKHRQEGVIDPSDMAYNAMLEQTSIGNVDKLAALKNNVNVKSSGAKADTNIKSPADQVASDLVNALQTGLQSVQSMNVTAQSVTILNSNGQSNSNGILPSLSSIFKPGAPTSMVAGSKVNSPVKK